ncbi:hypothetical protein SAMN05216174_110218 [Actinokineospora iranica]|uniref:Uncharacterized protein n=1 Tax=Actinokineospora iranica TaxID=1271860 RepID=A0A1G6UCY1_9PSEU|nr:hypothetical protein SAMN05216174_110218 [Actinokineospora iranica]
MATRRSWLDAFGVTTVRDLGTNKYFLLAAALVELDKSAK